MESRTRTGPGWKPAIPIFAALLLFISGTRASAAAPNITSALTASGTAGSAFNYQIATDTSPTSFNAASLPAGLIVDTSLGIISGTPSSAGTANVALSAVDPDGTGTATLVLTINAAVPPAPVITSALVVSVASGTAFSYQIAATNSPTSFNAAGLPAGLGVNTSNGLISGTPGIAGTSSITLSAVNAGGTGTAALVLTVNPPAPVITSGLAASGNVGAAFSYQIAATNLPTSFTAAGLPAGLVVNTTNGVISGTPGAAGSSIVAIGAVNAGGTGTAALVLTVGTLAPVITSALAASGKVGTAFNYQIAATNLPTSFNAAGLPAGLSVNTTNGVISGTPSSMGSNNVAISAINAGGTGNAALVLTINPLAPVITSARSVSGIVGAAFRYQIAAANSPTSFDAADLPDGLRVDTNSGVISGTPTSTGTIDVAISATNVTGTSTATLSFSVTMPSSGGTAAADLSEVRVYPIPYRPGSGNPDLGGGSTGIVFDRLPASASIKINTVSGQLVTSFDASSASGSFNWDARNGGGRDVASGLYLAIITSPSSKTVTKKILIIR